MIPKECKRLAEVDFPIADVSRHAAREKSIRHGHPSTLHLWWARRPLASSRAVLMALLLPDPCDPHCPEEFKTRARELLLSMRERPSGWNSLVKTDRDSGRPCSGSSPTSPTGTTTPRLSTWKLDVVWSPPPTQRGRP